MYSSYKEWMDWKCDIKNNNITFEKTGSLANEIEDIAPDVKEKFNRSNFAKDHSSGVSTWLNKNIPGLMKDEAGKKKSLNRGLFKSETLQLQTARGRRTKEKNYTRRLQNVSF